MRGTHDTRKENKTNTQIPTNDYVVVEVTMVNKRDDRTVHRLGKHSRKIILLVLDWYRLNPHPRHLLHAGALATSELATRGDTNTSVALAGVGTLISYSKSLHLPQKIPLSYWHDLVVTYTCFPLHCPLSSPRPHTSHQPPNTTMPTSQRAFISATLLLSNLTLNTPLFLIPRQLQSPHDTTRSIHSVLTTTTTI